MEWPDYYEAANHDDLLRFFDRYLKDVANGWETTPRVRYIDLFPVGLLIRPGEQVRLTVSGSNRLGGAIPGTENVPNANRGRHVIHTGGSRASVLQVPLMQRPGLFEGVQSSQARAVPPSCLRNDCTTVSSWTLMAVPQAGSRRRGRQRRHPAGSDELAGEAERERQREGQARARHRGGSRHHRRIDEGRMTVSQGRASGQPSGDIVVECAAEHG